MKPVVVTRRSLLLGTGAAAFVLATDSSRAQSLHPIKAIESPSTRKLKVVIAGGHPGDPEYGCGGTIATLVKLGHEVILLYLNDGAWPPTPAATRLAEAKLACELLKARPAYAGQKNGATIVDAEHYEHYAKLLEEIAPDAVFTHWMIDNHRDHRATAMFCYDAWQRAGSKYALYYYEVSDGEDTVQFSPNCYVDISKTESIKKSACYAHASQTPDRYYALQDQVATFRGLECGARRAEAFLLQQQSPYDIFAGKPPS